MTLLRTGVTSCQLFLQSEAVQRQLKDTSFITSSLQQHQSLSCGPHTQPSANCASQAHVHNSSAHEQHCSRTTICNSMGWLQDLKMHASDHNSKSVPSASRQCVTSRLASRTNCKPDVFQRHAAATQGSAPRAAVMSQRAHSEAKESLQRS